MQWKMKIGTNFKINTTSIHGKHVSMVNYCKKKTNNMKNNSVRP